MRKLASLVFFLMMLYIVAACFASCKTTKHIAKQSSKTDSSSITATHTVQVSSADTFAASTIDSSFENSFVIEFDTTGIATERAEELAGPQTITINGHHITSNKPIKRIKVKEAGKLSTTDISTANKKDSTAQNTNTATVVEKEENKTVKQVEHKTYLPVWGWLMVIALSAFTYLSVAYQRTWFPFAGLPNDDDDDA